MPSIRIHYLTATRISHRFHSWHNHSKRIRTLPYLLCVPLCDLPVPKPLNVMSSAESSSGGGWRRPKLLHWLRRCVCVRSVECGLMSASLSSDASLSTSICSSSSSSSSGTNKVDFFCVREAPGCAPLDCEALDRG